MIAVSMNTQLLFELCEQASTEQEPQHMIELIGEINRLLDDKRRRLTLARRGKNADVLDWRNHVAQRRAS